MEIMGVNIELDVGRFDDHFYSYMYISLRKIHVHSRCFFNTSSMKNRIIRNNVDIVNFKRTLKYRINVE